MFILIINEKDILFGYHFPQQYYIIHERDQAYMCNLQP